MADADYARDGEGVCHKKCSGDSTVACGEPLLSVSLPLQHFGTTLVPVPSCSCPVLRSTYDNPAIF